MTKLSQIREEFIEASCSTSATQAQIQDMSMAFDAGCITLLQMVLEINEKDEHEAEYELALLAKEIAQIALFHSAE